MMFVVGSENSAPGKKGPLTSSELFFLTSLFIELIDTERAKEKRALALTPDYVNWR